MSYNFSSHRSKLS